MFMKISGTRAAGGTNYFSSPGGCELAYLAEIGSWGKLRGGKIGGVSVLDHS
jgi:hypothetical protein